MESRLIRGKILGVSLHDSTVGKSNNDFGGFHFFKVDPPAASGLQYPLGL
jgi:hypothetical protein